MIGGRLLTNVYKKESGAIDFLKGRIAPDSTVYTDEAYSWKGLHKAFRGFKINHTERYVDGPNDHITTNRVESFFSRLRRAEIGQYHSVAGAYLDAYGDEAAWREDNRRLSNGEQFSRIVAISLSLPKSASWSGYWQRHVE